MEDDKVFYAFKFEQRMIVSLLDCWIVDSLSSINYHLSPFHYQLLTSNIH